MEPLLCSKNRYVVYRDFLSHQEQLDLAREVLLCHDNNNNSNNNGVSTTDWTSLNDATASSKINLGIPCGSSIELILPLAVKVSRQLFSRARHDIADAAAADDDAPESSSYRILSNLAKEHSHHHHHHLTGLALLYGPKATMSPHYDSPTQPGQKQEWLCMMTMGATIHFLLDHVTVMMRSGDCLVMDSMAVKHGVVRIGEEQPQQQPQQQQHHSQMSQVLPIHGCRLGILVWQGRVIHNNDEESTGATNKIEEDQVDGMSMLFGDE